MNEAAMPVGITNRYRQDHRGNAALRQMDGTSIGCSTLAHSKLMSNLVLLGQFCYPLPKMAVDDGGRIEKANLAAFAHSTLGTVLSNPGKVVGRCSL